MVVVECFLGTKSLERGVFILIFSKILFFTLFALCGLRCLVSWCLVLHPYKYAVTLYSVLNGAALPNFQQLCLFCLFYLERWKGNYSIRNNADSLWWNICTYIYIYIKLLYFIFNYFFGYAMQHVESLLPWPGIKPMPLAVEAWSLNPWTTREVHLMEYVFIYKSLVLLSKHSISLVVLVIFLSDSVHQFNQYLCFFFFSTSIC